MPNFMHSFSRHNAPSIHSTSMKYGRRVHSDHIISIMAGDGASIFTLYQSCHLDPCRPPWVWLRAGENLGIAAAPEKFNYCSAWNIQLDFHSFQVIQLFPAAPERKMLKSDFSCLCCLGCHYCGVLFLQIYSCVFQSLSVLNSGVGVNLKWCLS